MTPFYTLWLLSGFAFWLHIVRTKGLRWGDFVALPIVVVTGPILFVVREILGGCW